MTETSLLLARLLADPALAGSLGDVLAASDAALRELAAGLIEQGRAGEAHALCAARLSELPEAGAWHLLSARALAAMGRVEQAIRILVAVRAAGLPCERLYEEMLTLAVTATNAYESCMTDGDFARAIDVCDQLMALCPGVEPFARGRQEAAHALQRLQAEQALQRAHAAQGERLTWAYLDTLEGRAETCVAQRDLAGELECRLEILRHPLEPVRHGALRLKNISSLLAYLLRADIEAFSRAQLEQITGLLALVAAVPPGAPDAVAWSDDAMGWWGRHQQTLLGTIELDRVFAVPLAPEPALPTSFLSASGTAMDIGDVAARSRALGARVVFFTSASAEYFARYARTYVTTMLAACDCSALVVICVCAPFEDLAGHVAALGIDDRRLIFCSDHFDPRTHPFTIWSMNHFAPLTVNAAYFASAALLRTEILLEHLAIPVVVSGIDTVLRRGVLDMIERFRNADVVLNRLRSHALLGAQFVNNLVLLYPTPNGLLFARFLKAYLGPHLAAPVQAIFQDQLDLHMARHHLMTFGQAPAVQYFDETDINNAIFTRANFRQYADQMRRYRFLNLFVSAFVDEALTGEDVAPVAIAA